jgi:hypothetical protein
MGLLAGAAALPSLAVQAIAKPSQRPVSSQLKYRGNVLTRDHCGSFAEYGMFGTVGDYVMEAIVMSAEGSVTPQTIRAAPDVFAHAVSVLVSRIPKKEGQHDEVDEPDFRFFRYRFYGAIVVPDPTLPAGEMRLLLNGEVVAVLSGWTA